MIRVIYQWVNSQLEPNTSPFPLGKVAEALRNQEKMQEESGMFWQIT